MGSFRNETTADRFLQSGLSRRSFLRRTALFAGAAGFTSLLAACGGGDGEDEETDEPTAETGAEEQPTATRADPAEATSADVDEEPTDDSASSEEDEPAATSETESTDSASGDNPRHFGLPVEPAQSDGGEIIAGAFYGSGTFSPLAYLNSGPTRPMYETLVDVGPNKLDVVGNLAESWEVSDDGLTITFPLRAGVTWHDGEPFTADDVKTTFDLHLNPESGSPATSTLSAIISEVEVVDELAVAFHLVELKPTLLHDPLPDVFIGAEHILGQYEPSELAGSPIFNGEDLSQLIGTGPFRFAGTEPQATVRYERYEDYWDGRPHLEAVTYQFVSDSAAASGLLRTGELDYFKVVDPSTVAVLEAADVSLPVADSSGIQTIQYNLDPEMTPLFQDVRVRQALLYALDREQILQAAEFGFGSVPQGIMPPSSELNDPAGLKIDYSYDPDKAKVLLDEAGWVEGSDGVREKDGQRLEFAAYTWTGDTTSEGQILACQEYWRQIGAQMEVKLEDATVLWERAKRHEFEVLFWPISPSIFGDVTPDLACSSYNTDANYVNYCNPELDELLQQLAAGLDGLMQQASGGLDIEARRELVTQVQNIVMADLPVAPLSNSQVVGAVSNRLHNVFYNASTSDVTFNLETWWVEG